MLVFQVTKNWDTSTRGGGILIWIAVQSQQTGGIGFRRFKQQQIYIRRGEIEMAEALTADQSKIEPNISNEEMEAFLETSWRISLLLRLSVLSLFADIAQWWCQRLAVSDFQVFPF